ncbi:MAG: abortive infection family protein [Myxococcales bacterium]|nr:abortive infection family protein [Myxococcales bacterium]
MSGLTRRDVMVVVNRYIGVSGGYLGDFSYRTHAEFYPEYCDLDIDPYERDGTTRERFIEILLTAPPDQQAKILRGVVERFPVAAADAPPTRTAELRATIEQMVARLAGGPHVPAPRLPDQAEAVRRALADAEHLIATSGATSAVDRVHTALHAYLHGLCADAGISVDDTASLTSLFKTARKGHPALQPEGPRSGDIDKILRAFSAVLDALNPLRNQASMAHPQAELLPVPEAMLVVHASRTVMHYLTARLDSVARQEATP